MSNRKFSATDFNNRHFVRVEDYAGQIERIYQTALAEATRIAVDLKINPDARKPFDFSDYPASTDRVRAMLQRLATGLLFTIRTGQTGEWNFANQKNDGLVGHVLGRAALSRGAVSRYMARNLEALAAFQTRKVGGLDLSDRVFTYVGQFRREIELGLDVGLGEGRSAAQLSRNLRSYLNEPDKLFRRIKTQRGNLALSKAAQAYAPGQGVYRSSYKNALRLARTEINGSYRLADHLRWKQLDFVVGIEVRRSNNPVSCDVCPSLVGLYPKTYKFVGNHPNCRCVAVPILATKEELNQLNKALLNDESIQPFSSVNEIKDVNQNFKNYIANNKDKIARAKNVPLFIQENKQFIR